MPSLLELGQPNDQQEPQTQMAAVPSLLDIAKQTPQQGGGQQQQDLGWADTAGDIAASGTSGAIKGLGYGIGSVGDLRHLAGQGIDWAGEKLGASPETLATTKKAIKSAIPFGSVINRAPTSDQVHKFTQENITGDFYKPQTTAGKYAESVGEFAGNPVSYIGPGGLGIKAGMAIAGGLGSEAGREGAEALGLPEAPASIAGTLLASALARRVGAGKNVTANPNIPDTGELFGASDRQYDIIRKIPVEIKQSSGINLIQDTFKDLDAKGLKGPIAKTTRNLLDDFADDIGKSPITDFNTIDAYRKAFGHIATAKGPQAGTLGPQDARAARETIRRIDDWMVNLGARDVHSGAHYLPALNDLAKDARANWGAAARALQLDELVERAGIRAAVTGAGANKENQLRQHFARILNNKKQFGKYTQEEQDLIKEVATGNWARNTMRLLGKAAPTGIVSAMGDIVAGGGNMAKAAAIGAAGHFFKRAAENATNRAVERAQEAVRSRSPLYQQNLKYNRLVRPERPSLLPLAAESVQQQEP